MTIPMMRAHAWPMAGVETNIRIELGAQGEHAFLLMIHFGLPTDD